MTRSLTPKRLAFVREYLANGRNATAAHRVAYPGASSGPSRAVTACNLLKDPRIAAIVAEADRQEAAVTAEVIERYAISRRRIAEQLAKIAFAEMGDYIRIGFGNAVEIDIAKLIRDGGGGLVELLEVVQAAPGTVSDRAGWRININLGMRCAALITLARVMGYFRPEPPTGRTDDPPAPA